LGRGIARSERPWHAESRNNPDQEKTPAITIELPGDSSRAHSKNCGEKDRKVVEVAKDLNLGCNDNTPQCLSIRQANISDRVYRAELLGHQRWSRVEHNTVQSLSSY